MSFIRWSDYIWQADEDKDLPRCHHSEIELGAVHAHETVVNSHSLGPNFGCPDSPHAAISADRCSLHELTHRMDLTASPPIIIRTQISSASAMISQMIVIFGWWNFDFYSR